MQARAPRCIQLDSLQVLLAGLLGITTLLPDLVQGVPLEQGNSTEDVSVLDVPTHSGGKKSSATGTWEVVSQNTCHGSMTVYEACTGLPECGACQPVDCSFTEWEDWYGLGGCSGLCKRSRQIAHINNECGQPCDDVKIETRKCDLTECLVAAQDCVLGAWTAWTPETCTSPVEQKYRERMILTPPLNGGKSCLGPTRETQPCFGNRPVDCELTSWNGWTSCSRSCGGGVHSRMRRVAREADNGGHPCHGSLAVTEPCNAEPCGEVHDCILSEWTEWDGCDLDTPNQRFRSRSVEQHASGGGMLCKDKLKETASCKDEPVNCKLSNWGDWQACDQTCDGGQRLRTRHLEAPPKNGGSCERGSLRETAPCGLESCEEPGSGNCQLSAWEEWSECSARCGFGLKTRSREVAALATYGLGCTGALSEVVECERKLCDVVDCHWDEWSQWSACTCTCGGGTKRRSRVVKVAPENGGKPCAGLDKQEVWPCNEQSCEAACRNGTWSQWSGWSACSSTCGSGYQSRAREIDQEPNACGMPASGTTEEYRPCGSLPSCTPDKDCKVSNWGSWSDCSCTCFGVRERHRVVTQYKSGNGAACVDLSLKTIEPCNPGHGQEPGPHCMGETVRNCTLDDWTQWSECSATCGSGQKSRSRHILTPASNNGLPCANALAETTSCDLAMCRPPHCYDCLWRQWSEWGDCSKCGGQRWRHRSVAQMPNYCGEPCAAKSAKEVSNCTSHCDPDLYCAWSAWSETSTCSSTCGAASKRRHRSLGLHTAPGSGYLFKGTGSITCTGVQVLVIDCNLTSCDSGCVPRNCAFADWSDWHSPMCTGLCERHRVIGIPNNECGQPCTGALVDTKRCEPDCIHPQDCVLGNWGAWGVCTSLEAQRYRTRSIRQMPANGGKPCEGALRETASCSRKASPPVDCELTSWSAWGDCTRTCGGGWQTRNRRLKKTAMHGGTPCTDSLEELQQCALDECMSDTRVDCAVGEWQKWGGCQSNGQKYRKRSIIQQATGTGLGCEESLEMTEPCTVEYVDCKLSVWTSWDACDRTCGGGQKQRHRQIEIYPQHGGKACADDLNLAEVVGCNEDVPCSPVLDCKVSSWSLWSTCSATCGVGQQTRTRNVSQLREVRGEGCEESLAETQSCLNPDCGNEDCKWGDWTSWTICTRTCGGGQQSRARDVEAPPRQGGLPCAAEDKEQLQACNIFDCGKTPCVDAVWGQWAPWEPCSKTCLGGTTWRARTVETPATNCGQPALGLSQEVARCNDNVTCVASVDCVFGDWDIWSGCSDTCFGVQRRTRRIAVHGRGGGAFCEGHLKETQPCNPGRGGVVPEGCPTAGQPLDCTFAFWQEWSDCTTTCGGGQRTRERGVQNEAENGGRGCNGTLGETQPCATATCPPSGEKVSCKWGDWGDWGACDKCGGQRKRMRHVLQEPHSGGHACAHQASEETVPCPRHCHERWVCAWSDWGPYSTCSSTCGKGTRSRKRDLQSAPEATALWEEAPTLQDTEAFSSRLEALRQRQERMAERRPIELLSAALLGACGSLMAGFILYRITPRCVKFFSGSQGGYEPHRVSTLLAQHDLRTADNDVIGFE